MSFLFCFLTDFCPVVEPGFVKPVCTCTVIVIVILYIMDVMIMVHDINEMRTSSVKPRVEYCISRISNGGTLVN